MGMSIGKATAASAAEMLSTMAVRVRMLPCSGESAALRRSANTRSSSMFNTNSGLPARRGGVPSALTLAAVALRALVRGAAPLWAAAAGAA